MRILIAHEAVAGGGGVESYLASVIPALLHRGHAVAFLHHHTRKERGPMRLEFGDVASFSVADDGFESALERATAWGPNVCFSHNMRHLEVDDALTARWPVVKMMHGYSGTCVSGQKAYAFPAARPCSRTFGAGCLALYLPRGCGQRRPVRMLEQYVSSRRQRSLFDRYSSMVVASGHMQEEYVRHGMPRNRVVRAPLFPTTDGVTGPRVRPAQPTVLFAGRMTKLKGPAVLVEAVKMAAALMDRPLKLVMAGEGPERDALMKSARAPGIDAAFPGWVTGNDRNALIRSASIVAVPSVWPEPFGLVGLEAGAHGVPAVAFDVGGISEWLRDGVNGRLVDAGNVTGFARALAAILADGNLLGFLERGALSVAAEMTLDTHLRIVERTLEKAAG